MWAEYVLAVLCIFLGTICGLSSLVVLWGGAMKRAATGETDAATGNWALFLAFLAVAGVGGGTLIFVS
jgi:hypothetical protein